MASAQAQPQPAAAPAQTSGPEAILPVDIPTRADLDEQYADEVVRRVTGQDPMADFAPGFDALNKSINALANEYDRRELDTLPVIRLESLDRHWRLLRHQLEDWRAQVRRGGDIYLQDAAQLSERAAAWKLTRERVTAAATPALLTRIDDVEGHLRKASEALADPVEKQLQLNQRANFLETRILDGQNRVADAIAFNDRRLTRIDAPPLWVAASRLDGSSGVDAITFGLNIENRFLEEYNEVYRVGRNLYRAAALLLAPLLGWLWLRMRKVESDDPDIQSSLRVLKRPVATWLLLTASGVLVVAPDAPVFLHQAALFVVLIPVLRLLPPRVYQLLGPWPYVASGLYLADLLDYFFLTNAFYHRCYLLFVTVLALGLLAWLLASGRRRRQAAGVDEGALGGLVHVMRAAAWLAASILLGSAVSNVIGNVSLAEMLTGAVLLIGYVGLALFAGASVLSSMLQLLLTRRGLAETHLFRTHGASIFRGATRLLHLFAIIGWFLIALDRFRILRPLYAFAEIVLTYRLTVGQIAVSLGSILTFVLSIFVALWVGRTVRLLLRDEVLSSLSLPRGVANSVSSLTYYAVVFIGFFLALAAAGFELGQLAIMFGALGVGIGLGLQNIVQNFVSGLILMFERPIQPGDVIEVAGTAGTVRNIGIRATTLTTFDGAEAMLPNGTLLSEKLVNWTLSNMNRRIEVNVGVAYGTPPTRVLELLLDVARTTPGIIADPAPSALFVGFGESSLDFTLRAWTDNFAEWVNIRSHLTTRLHAAIEAAGIEIPFPQRDLHLRSIAPGVNPTLGDKPGSPERAQMPR